MFKKMTMTLNLNERDMEALEKLSLEMDLNKSAIMRQALKMYQSAQVRASRGERMIWVDKDGNNTELLMLSKRCLFDGVDE